MVDNLPAASEMLQLVEDRLEHTQHDFLLAFEGELVARTTLPEPAQFSSRLTSLTSSVVGFPLLESNF